MTHSITAVSRRDLLNFGVALTGVVEIDSLVSALKEALPERNHRFIPANVKAIEAGVERAGGKKA